MPIGRQLRVKLLGDIIDEMVGFGPLEQLLKDDTITEIMVNGHQTIYTEQKGKLELSPIKFLDVESCRRVIDKILSPLGRRVDESSPLCDARLPDGSRVNVIIPPLALNGPTITIRKFSKSPLTMEKLIGYRALSQSMAMFLKACVHCTLNIVISGGTGSGKTTMLNALSSYIPDGERIITIEDAAELNLQQDHVVRLESKPKNIEGKGEVSIRDLVKNSLRMRPDRIVIGECRGGEALDMIQAMNTGHDGSLTTTHANTPRDAIARLETLVMMAGMDLARSLAIRQQISGAVHLIVQINRLADGSRKCVAITEIQGMEGNMVTLQDVFKYEQTGVNPEGKLIGVTRGLGIVPKAQAEVQCERAEHSRRDLPKRSAPQQSRVSLGHGHPTLMDPLILAGLHPGMLCPARRRFLPADDGRRRRWTCARSSRISPRTLRRWRGKSSLAAKRNRLLAAVRFSRLLRPFHRPVLHGQPGEGVDPVRYSAEAGLNSCGACGSAWPS